jgi:hypothetical protein
MKTRLWMVLLCIYTGSLFAQDSTSILRKTGKVFHNVFYRETYGKNIIKYNPMASTLFSDPRNTGFGYERTTYRNQSASLNAGMFFFPVILDKDFGAVKSSPRNNKGFIISADYRFYLKKLNTRPAPNGIYIGPYYSVYRHKGGVDFEYIDETGTSPVNYNAQLESQFTFHNVGFQLGYQFIFWKRLSMDLVLFGPAYSFYDIRLDLSSNLSADQQSDIYQKYKDSFFAKYPVFEDLLDKANFSKSGVSRGTAANFRYTIQFGYCF